MFAFSSLLRINPRFSQPAPEARSQLSPRRRPWAQPHNDKRRKCDRILLALAAASFVITDEGSNLNPNLLKWYPYPVRPLTTLELEIPRISFSSRRIQFSLFCFAVLGLCFPLIRASADPQTPTPNPLGTNITSLVETSAKFNDKRVRVFASFHSDGIEHSVLMEPNCGQLHRTSTTPPQMEPQCGRGVVPVDSDKAEKDPGNAALDRVLAQNPLRGTLDKYITAEFTGIFRCVPSCASPKYFSLEIEHVENLKVEMKNLNPHRPTE